jgi:hypothetical protein
MFSCFQEAVKVYDNATQCFASSCPESCLQRAPHVSEQAAQICTVSCAQPRPSDNPEIGSLEGLAPLLSVLPLFKLFHIRYMLHIYTINIYIYHYIYMSLDRIPTPLVTVPTWKWIQGPSCSPECSWYEWPECWPQHQRCRYLSNQIPKSPLFTTQPILWRHSRSLPLSRWNWPWATSQKAHDECVSPDRKQSKVHSAVTSC